MWQIIDDVKADNPDMLGYGGTDKPADPAAYSLKRLCGDLAALLDLVDAERAVIVGHDWGAVTAWRFALYYPERVLALVTCVAWHCFICLAPNPNAESI